MLFLSWCLGEGVGGARAEGKLVPPLAGQQSSTALALVAALYLGFNQMSFGFSSSSSWKPQLTDNSARESPRKLFVWPINVLWTQADAQEMRNTCQSQLLVAVSPPCCGHLEFTKQLQEMGCVGNSSLTLQEDCWERETVLCRGEHVDLRLLLAFCNRQMLSRPWVVARVQTRSACVLHGCFGLLCMHIF